MTSKRNAAPAASSTIEKEARRPTEGGDGTQETSEEQRSLSSERTLWGSHSRGIVTAAPILKTGSVEDVSGARPNWAAIAASPGKPTPRYLAGCERLYSSVEQGPSCQRAAISSRHRIFGSRLRASPGRGDDEAQAGLIVGRVTQVVPGASL